MLTIGAHGLVSKSLARGGLGHPLGVLVVVAGASSHHTNSGIRAEEVAESGFMLNFGKHVFVDDVTSVALST